MPTYGVFTLHNGAWRLQGVFTNRGDADRELTYLRDMLGLVAEVFVKKASTWS